MSDLRTGTHPDIWWYIIYDTNWLLSQPPVAQEFTVFPARQLSNNKWELFAVRYLLPNEVKRELTELKGRDHNHQEIANARRWLVYLFSLTKKEWKRSVIVEDRHDILRNYYDNPTGVMAEDYADIVRDLPLVSCAEVDILDLPAMRTEEGHLGADSATDRQMLALARMIASPPLGKNCFIATFDTGVEAEVASLFYNRSFSIGCPAIRRDYTLNWQRTYERIAQIG